MLIDKLYSEVHRARSRKTGALVALKKIIMHHEKDGVGDAITASTTSSILTPFSFPSPRSEKSSFSNSYRIKTSYG